MAVSPLSEFEAAAPAKPLRIALAGNPNSGKTTLFNKLTGSHYKVANYPGVTVEKREGRLELPEVGEVILVDLPGTYSLCGTSLDEIIATKALLGGIKGEEFPDLIIAVVDASNIERNLYLVSQLVDAGAPVLLALNMIDLAERQGVVVYAEKLSRALDVPVVKLVAREGRGIEELRATAVQLLTSRKVSSQRLRWLNGNQQFKELAERLGTVEAKNRGWGNAPLLIGSALLSEALTPEDPGLQSELAEARSRLTADNIDPLSFEATQRYRWINSVVRGSCSFASTSAPRLHERIDALVTHPVWGTLIFVLIMATIFQGIFLWAQVPMEFIDTAVASLGTALGELLPAGQLRSLIVDGIVAGVGSVVIFIPQIAVLFLCLGILEDTGYLSRAAFLMDRLMRHVGLQGRSFIPLLSSFACAIPGIMSTRSIPTWADRITTIMVAPLMSCSARLPVYTVLIAAFVPREKVFGFISLQGLTLLGMYVLGIVGAAVVALLLKSTILRRQPAIFVMEMPPFRLPAVKVILHDVLDRIVIFLKNAGTIILACSIVLWFLASYPRPENGAEEGGLRHSYAGKIGTFIEPVIKPLGFNWEIGVGILASFAAREVFVSALATVYNLESGDDAEATSLISVLQGKKRDGSFATVTALSLMVFYVFACQCMSTLAVCRRETGSWRWTGFMLIYMTALAYFASFVTYQIGTNLL